MDVSANFAFLQQEFPHVAESASFAERHVYGDPRASCFHARHALENLLKRIYRVDKALEPPPVQNLDSYLSGETFIALVPDAVWHKAEFVRQAGNVAVHGKKTPTTDTALDVVRELYHVLYWAGRTYLRKGAESLTGATYDETLVPRGEPAQAPTSVDELQRVASAHDEAEEARKELEDELETLRERLAAIKAENAAVPETHDWNEDVTRTRIIDLALERAGWDLAAPNVREYEVTGMPTPKGVGFADYVLWGDDGKPLGVVEAKKTSVDARVGKRQAELYADCLEAMHGQRPVIFYTNGYTTHLWDDAMYPPRTVAGFYTKAELAGLVLRRTQRKPLDGTQVKDEIAGRYYQKRAIVSIAERFASKHRKALLVMATGTGKTRTAVALVDLLQRAGWIKRALFLADRRKLVKQAVNAFKEHLPESSPVNLLTDRDATGRVFVSTYPTMMGMIDDGQGGARFGPGHFDLVIIDEAHRSVYQKFGEIFEYFDSLLVGLTATPREQIDRNTYTLFNLEPGIPTDAYELNTAVRDGYLVPARVCPIDLKFPREGIDYDSLSDDEKAQWESLDWGDDVDPGELPDRVNASAINSWLFNTDTVDKVLQYVMEHGHKVAGGDRIAKTIIFARNSEHAKFIEERFDCHYPHHAGHFARAIDYTTKYADTLMDEFEKPDEPPHIAISVDMLDTGVDIPCVANLVFFKPVYSKIKFLQMIGRGTRLCPDLFGPGIDKRDFRVFDACFNYDFFGENPDGIEQAAAVPLGTRLFRSRLELLRHVQTTPDLDDKGALADALVSTLHGEVDAMNADNFIVRMHAEAVDRFRLRDAWARLNEDDRELLRVEVAGLPSEIESDEVESKLFDLKALRMQLAHADGNIAAYERLRQRMVEIAQLLEEKTAIPAVRAQLEYIASMQEAGFWDGMDLAGLEEMRLRLRGLVPLLDKKSRKIVYTDFEDEITGVREEELPFMPTMASSQFLKRVEAYLRDHQDHIVIHRLRTNQPLTTTDIEGLEQTLAEIGEDNGHALLTDLLARSEAPSLAHFVRSMVGMDRAAAQTAFGAFLGDQSLSSPQIRFVEMVIDQLTARGVMEAAALYEDPFTSLHSGGPDALFAGRDEVIAGIFDTLESMRPAVSDAG